MKYVVQKGDDEATLATMHHVSVGNLRKANELLPQPYLVEGRTIEIPTNDDAQQNNASDDQNGHQGVETFNPGDKPAE
ncbi:LysM domain-containing protein [Apilactobacillus micheneri]|uniref:LysM peptidoglycan-binding domain-containing protein n=1 Tax=Apilactobacillus micheneri TaxID=1899430 RepID=UPI0011298CEE|nr:LysM peptidoglycan-binding domain-containing protein [Apilactobacillus micheneri]TPR43159.1 LysM domain-containing protein [Apilactobacillus micheneri]TPR47247.1 LysM domain-containing protein [Apilactobacillus micheneri]